jgi:hypothetical protein
VRADTVLLAPLVFFLLLRSEGSLTRALAWSAALGVLMLGVYAAIFAMDPRIDNAVASVSRHMGSADNETRFWEYLLWSISPLPLIFAVWGMRSLLDSRPRLLALLLLWCLPTMLFYFRATTTPRYFVNVAFPLGIAVAVGMVEVAGRLRVWLRAPLAWALVIGLTTVHLFVALGHFRPDKLGWPLYGATISTHDGPMPTGALLYLSFHDDYSAAKALPHIRFATLTTQHWEGPSFTRAARRLADPAAPRRTVVVLLTGGWGHAFHYHVQVAGAHYVSRVASDAPWASEAWMELGNSRVMTIADWSDHYKRLPQFKVAAGDQIWVLTRETFPDSAALSKLPPALSLVAAESFDPHIRVFDVVGPGAMRP